MKKGITLFLGRKCNNDCIMCSIKKFEQLAYMLSYKEVEEKIEKNKGKVFSLVLTGGEPTEHSDILKIIKKAKDLGYEEIEINTNGRNFSDKRFVKKAVDAGLSRVRVAVHGLEKEHNKITQKNCFKEVMRGIENILEEGIYLSVDSVLMKINKDSLIEMQEMVLKMGVERISIGDVLPSSDNSVRFKQLTLPYTEKKKFLYNSLEHLSNFSSVFLCNFLRCILPLNIPQNITYLSPAMKEEKISFEGGLLNRGANTLYKKIEDCKKCPFKDSCFGFFKDSLKLFGEDDAREAIRFDNFIKESRKNF